MQIRGTKRFFENYYANIIKEELRDCLRIIMRRRETKRFFENYYANYHANKREKEIF